MGHIRKTLLRATLFLLVSISPLAWAQAQVPPPPSSGQPHPPGKPGGVPLGLSATNLPTATPTPVPAPGAATPAPVIEVKIPKEDLLTMKDLEGKMQMTPDIYNIHINELIRIDLMGQLEKALSDKSGT